MTASSASSALAQCALDSHSYSSDNLQLVERPGAALLRVHSLRDLPGEGEAFAGWPARTGACLDADPAVLCLRPREWLLVSETLDAAALCARLGDAVDRAATAVYDQSDGLARFRLSGRAAPWLLAKVGALDFTGDAFSQARCTRTRLGQIAVLVHFRGQADGTFDLIVDRSLARYLWELLIDAAPHAAELARSGWTAAAQDPAAGGAT